MAKGIGDGSTPLDKEAVVEVILEATLQTPQYHEHERHH